MTQQDEYECDHCGGTVAFDDTKCPHCGEPFEEDDEQPEFECSHCGGTVAGDAVYCQYCGERIEVVDPLTTFAQSFPINLSAAGDRVHQYTCTQCGAPLRPDDKFCRACGRALEPIVEPAERASAVKPRDGEVQCGECGAAIAPELKACPRCGIVFDPSTIIEPSDISSVESAAGFECEGCEQPVGNADVFCAHCGRNLAALSEATPAPSNGWVTLPWFLGFLRVAAILSIVIRAGCPIFTERIQVEHRKWHESLFSKGKHLSR